MKRRNFITLLGGAAAWPLAARAQQGERMRRIGVLMGQLESDPETPPRVAAFRQALGKFGWSEGQNVAIDFRWGGGDANRMRLHAKELIGTRPDVVVAESTPAAGSIAAGGCCRADCVFAGCQSGRERLGRELVASWHEPYGVYQF